MTARLFLKELRRMLGRPRAMAEVPAKQVGTLAELLHAHNLNPCFTALEVGARALETSAEPFHTLLDSFPGSRILAFEVDEALCAELNRSARPGLEFHAKALGRANETRTFHGTAHPMCSSLYEPDERWADLFVGLDVMRKTHSGTLDVTTLEHFARERGIATIDFIKIDIQGAELEFLQGAGAVLDSVLCMVCEVEFVALYKGQPLYGDVDAFLRSRGFMLHKFLGLGGRAMKPTVINDDPNFVVQNMWGDALFVRDLREPGRLSDEQLLKLAVCMEVYGSADVSHYLLSTFDRRRGTSLAEQPIRGSQPAKI